MHRAADDADIIDGIRQPHLRRNLLSHSRINLPVTCLRTGARGTALRVLLPSSKRLAAAVSVCNKKPKVESRCDAVVIGLAYLFPALSVAGASLAAP
jgi:hypothetical protein